MNFSVPVSFITEYKALPTLEGSTCGGGGGIACLSRVYTPCARMGAYTRVYADCRHSCLYFCRRLRPAHTRAYARIRRLSPSKFKHVELSWPAQTCAGIPANHESARAPVTEGRRVVLYRDVCGRIPAHTLACLYFYPRRNLRYAVASHRQTQA